MVGPIASLLLASLLGAEAPPAEAPPAEPTAAEPEVVVVPSGTPALPTPDNQPAPPTPPAAAPSPTSRPHRLLIMPFFGFQTISPVRDDITADAGNFGSGVRLGGMAGGRLNRSVSLNGAIAVDLGSESTAPEGYRGHLTEWLVSFCPLMHLGSDAVQVLVGPKLGLVRGEETSGNGNGGGPEQAWGGWTFGANLGVFFRMGRVVSLGGFITIDVIEPAYRTCANCGVLADPSYPPSHRVESASVALLF
jgi:hypothetical protein